MSSIWMTRLKARKNPDAPTHAPTEPTTGGSVGSVGPHVGQTQYFDAHIALWVDWNERAAIMEIDGGVSRRKAERAAAVVVSGRGR